MVFHDCAIDGGLPPWFFRSDSKDRYRYVPATTNPTEADVKTNPWEEHHQRPHLQPRTPPTSGSTTARSPTATTSTSAAVRFHHNWVHNINDDALNFGSDSTDAGRHQESVGLPQRDHSEPDRAELRRAAEGRPVRIFRNLVDLREPTLSIRPATTALTPSAPASCTSRTAPARGRSTCGTTPA